MIDFFNLLGIGISAGVGLALVVVFISATISVLVRWKWPQLPHQKNALYSASFMPVLFMSFITYVAIDEYFNPTPMSGPQLQGSIILISASAVAILIGFIASYWITKAILNRIAKL